LKKNSNKSATKKIEMALLDNNVLGTETHIDTATHMLVTHAGNNLTPEQVEIIKRNAPLIKNAKYSSKTTRNDGTEAFQVHFGLTNFSGSQVKKWVYVLGGKALTRQELVGLTTTERKKIKRYGLFYDRIGSALLHGEIGEAVRQWLVHAAEALAVSSPERYKKMMEETAPFVCNGKTISLRLVDDLPFTNGTINYVEPNGVSVSLSARS
jgi:hypothetical protein